MPTSGDLKSGDCLFSTTPHPPNFNGPPPPQQTDPVPNGNGYGHYLKSYMTLHTIKIHVHRFDAKIIFFSAYCPETLLRIKKIQIWRGKWANSQTKAQKSAKDDVIREIW